MSTPSSAFSDAKIGVVTVTYNAANLLEDFFASLALQSFRNFTTYVIDNASADGTAQLVKERYFSQCELIENHLNLGVAEANNQGITRAIESGCTHVLLINNDTVFNGQLFEILLASLRDSEQKIVVPKIPFESNPKTLWFGGGSFGRFAGFTGSNYAYGEEDLGQRDSPQLISFAPTCCMLVRSDVFKTVGLMDPDYFVYFDDNDFCFRAVENGIKIYYQPNAVLLHKVGQSTEGDNSPFSVRYMVRNRVYFVRKHYGLFKQSIFLTFIFLLQLLRGVQRGNVLLRLRAFIAGYKMSVNGN